MVKSGSILKQQNQEGIREILSSGDVMTSYCSAQIKSRRMLNSCNTSFKRTLMFNTEFAVWSCQKRLWLLKMTDWPLPTVKLVMHVTVAHANAPSLIQVMGLYCVVKLREVRSWMKNICTANF